MTLFKCSYITKNGKPSKETFNICSEYIDFENNEVKKEIKVIIDNRWNLLPPGLSLYIHELVRN
jgi:hypothetical protein